VVEGLEVEGRDLRLACRDRFVDDRGDPDLGGVERVDGLLARQDVPPRSY
jgi:hypothetical protein